jgi:phospholipid transport system substrate-binding protein
MRHAIATLSLMLLLVTAALAQPAPDAGSPVEAAATAPAADPAALSEAARRAQSEDDPRALIEARYAQIKDIIARTVDEETVREQIKALTLEFVDYEEFARLTIKREWKELNDQQRGAFVSWFKRLIQATYARHFKPRQDLTITYRGETQMRRGKAKTDTTVSFSDTSVDVDYKFLRRDDKAWWVYDIVIDDVSLMRNYRGQFRRILKKDGYDALMDKIREAVKRKEGGAEEDGALE